jgi:hypothetical protein
MSRKGRYLVLAALVAGAVGVVLYIAWPRPLPPRNQGLIGPDGPRPKAAGR